ncbi:MAG: hydrogen gas-evolving membrane-bound hydrogenase subunit E [Candidatus Saliniplasma sp.]
MEIRKVSIKKIVTISFLFFIVITLLSGLGLEHEDKQESVLKEYYVENRKTTGSDNIVSAILLDYRAYDTFGEVMVLYVAITGVIILGMKSKKDSEGKEKEENVHMGGGNG